MAMHRGYGAMHIHMCDRILRIEGTLLHPNEIWPVKSRKMQKFANFIFFAELANLCSRTFKINFKQGPFVQWQRSSSLLKFTAELRELLKIQ